MKENLLISEDNFDDLFNEMISLVIKNKDQRNRKIINAISDIYTISEYIPEILLYEKQINQRLLVFHYNTDPSIVDANVYTTTSVHTTDGIKTVINSKKLNLEFTLNCFYSFFITYYHKNDNKLIEDNILLTIISSIELLMDYISNNKD